MEINKIYNEDCLITMKNMPNDFINLTITSPPYDNLRDYKGYSFNFESIAKELFRITKDGGIIVWIVSDSIINGSESGTSFRQALYFKEIGFNIHDTMIWSKDTFSFPDKTRYRNTFEYMFVLSKNKINTINLINDRKNKWSNTKVHGTSRNKDGSLFIKSNNNKTKVSQYGVRFNVWEQSVEKNSDTFKHPAMFPEKLINDHILSWSNKGDLIYDCFMGSGTTAKMSIINKRNFIGSEISSDYCEIANKRINDIKSKLTLF